MTSVKATIHQLVDELSDDDADRILVYLRSVAANPSAPPPMAFRVSEGEAALLEHARPLSADDPLWSLLGIVEDGPADASVNHDAYLTDQYDHRRRDE